MDIKMGRNKWQNTAIHLILGLLSVCFVIPFLLVISVSLSNEKDIVTIGYALIPRNFDLMAYKFLWNGPDAILSAYKVTILSTVVGTTLSVFLMSLLAYPLSRNTFDARKPLAFYIFFTLIFNGGLVPTYILITRYLRLGDTIWVFIIPGLVNAWHVFLLRTFFVKLPASIIEAAYIDGASEFRIFFTMVLPLSKPVLATVALLGALTRWNDWFTAMLYINDENLLTLQYLLQRILMNIQLLQQEGNQMQMMGITQANIPSETVRMAMAIVAAGPMLIVFPFFQKYFVRGLTVGSVKG